MTAFAILFTMAAIGMAETAYLIRKRKEAEKPTCPIGGGCAAVLESKFNKIFGVHNDILGFLFYVAMAAVTAFVVIGVEPMEWWNAAASLMVSVALAMSVALFYLQWRVIKAWCFWCLMSAGTVLVMALVLSAHGFRLANLG